MQKLPTPAERTWILERLRDLVDACGRQRILDAAIVLPNDTFFVDAWSPNAAGVYVLARRLLGFAGLGELEPSIAVFVGEQPVVETTASGTQSHHAGAAAWFAGIEGTTCHFGAEVTLLGDAERLVAAMAHEVAHAFRCYHGLESEDAEEEERLTDLTTIYLGFGLLTTNASYLYRSSGDLVGYMAYTEWSHASLGYLPPQAMSFALAAYADARGLDGSAVRRLKGELETTQAAMFAAALRSLTDDDTLRAAVSAPPEGNDPFDPGALDPITSVPQALLDLPDPEPEPEVAPVAGRRVFHVERTFRPGWLLCGGIGAVVGLVALPKLGIVAYAGAAVFVTLVARFAYRQHVSKCSDPNCAHALEGGEETCPGCGGVVSGKIAHENERLDAEERLRSLGPGN